MDRKCSEISINSNEEIESFVDKYISSGQTQLPEPLQEAQTHKHSKTCRKNGQPVCRFHYPLPPMENTMILEPLNHNEIKNLNYLKNKYKEIFEFLKEQGTGMKMTFDEFLEKFQINRPTYIMCLQI